ncbi:MAG: ligase-associated DNA damage response endonuclease PdeM [Cohaesibacteraceae bacterium]|nr:ligase-associated DNA damage response endonuclease PdeM [Cohaesibacteraceae bacterium]
MKAEMLDSGVIVTVCGEELVPLLDGGLWWPNERTLIVSDLHLEKGSSQAGRGIFLPPYDTAKTLARLKVLIQNWHPCRIISLGDSFHDCNAESRMSETDQQTLKELVDLQEWIWIAGNHDPRPPANIGGHFRETLNIGPLSFVHEPGQNPKKGELSGHLHPAAKIRRLGRSVRRRCFVGNNQRLILPAFGAYTGGLNITDAAFDGLLATGSTAWVLGTDQIYPIAVAQCV